MSIGGAAALVIGLAAAPSSATTGTTWAVMPGGSFTGAMAGKTTLVDTTTGTTLVCGRTAATGSFKSGRGLPGAGIGSLATLTFAKCSGPGIVFRLTAGNLPWTLNAMAYLLGVKGGTTVGTVTGIHATISGRTCHATMDGSTATANDGQTEFHYHNTMSKLKIEAQNSNLHLYNVTVCTGLINAGDAVTFSTEYLLSPAQEIHPV